MGLVYTNPYGVDIITPGASTVAMLETINIEFARFERVSNYA
jgi:hypothetical protein